MTQGDTPCLIHLLTYLPRLPRLLAAEARATAGARGAPLPDGETDGHTDGGQHTHRALAVLRGRGTRLALLIASLLAGLVIALLTVHLVGPSQCGQPGQHHGRCLTQSVKLDSK